MTRVLLISREGAVVRVHCDREIAGYHEGQLSRAVMRSVRTGDPCDVGFFHPEPFVALRFAAETEGRVIVEIEGRAA